MTRVVISQPMFFPWVGMFEQIRMADVYVHYDDVQFPQGRSFINRVQIKTHSGSMWLTVPVLRSGLQLINQVTIDDAQKWRERHLNTLRQNYAKAPFGKEMLALAESIYALKTSRLAEFNIFGMQKIAAYFELNPQFERSSSLPVGGASSSRLLDITRSFGGDTYITGHGAHNYLDHQLLESNGVRVEYIDYQKIPYPQLYGEFTPFVSILDLVANLGKNGRSLIASKTVYWKDFIK
jgi:hypothetical protein